MFYCCLINYINFLLKFIIRRIHFKKKLKHGNFSTTLFDILVFNRKKVEAEERYSVDLGEGFTKHDSDLILVDLRLRTDNKIKEKGFC